MSLVNASLNLKLRCKTKVRHICPVVIDSPITVANPYNPNNPIILVMVVWSFPGGLMVKNLPANAKDVGSIPGLERSPGGGNGNPLQYSCLENSKSREAWWAAVHRVAKSQTWLSDWACTHDGWFNIYPEYIKNSYSPVMKKNPQMTQLKTELRTWPFFQRRNSDD